MSYTYDRSPSGAILRISRCHEGHLALMITDSTYETVNSVCITPEDVPEVLGEMQAWAAPGATSAMPHPS